LVVMLCGLAGKYQHFKGTSCLHLQGWSGGSIFLQNISIYLKVHSTQKTNIMNTTHGHLSFYCVLQRSALMQAAYLNRYVTTTHIKMQH
jgi:hypothetical protein